MAITPAQVKNQEFPIRLKGYDPDEVRSFLAEVAAAYRATIRDQGAQWALANISDDMAAVLRASHDAAEKVMALAEADANELRSRAQAEAEAIVAEADSRAQRQREDADREAAHAVGVLKRAQGEASTVSRDATEARQLLEEARAQAAVILAQAEQQAADLHAEAVDVVDANRRAAEADELHGIAVARYEEAQSAASALLSEAELRAKKVRLDAEQFASKRRREASEEREEARLLHQRVQEQTEAARLAAEDDARQRAHALLAEAQERIALLEASERQLQERLAAAQLEFEGIVRKLSTGTPATIDLTQDEPILVLDGRFDDARFTDELETFVGELHGEVPRRPVSDENVSRVDRGAIQRMVSAAVGRAVESSRP